MTVSLTPRQEPLTPQPAARREYRLRRHHLPQAEEGEPARHTVAAVVLNGVHPFELGVACEVFGLERPELSVPWYRFKVCAAEPSPIRTSVGFLMDTPHGLADLADADTLVFTH